MRELDKLRKLLEPRQLRWAPALALPLTTSVLAQVVCERNWSIYLWPAHQDQQAARTRYCHEVLHLRDKLQKVSYQQKVHKWENDSDSQAWSDDDKDLMA